jgi:hypothetical protein
MGQPVRFVITIEFAGEEIGGVAGRSTVRTAALDELFQAIKATLDQICDNLALVQRDDGMLLDGVVKLHTLSPSVLAFITTLGAGLRGQWLTAQQYLLRDVVFNGTGTFICSSAHTSGVFATDLAAGKWITISDTASFIASGIVFTPAAGITAIDVQAALAELDDEAAKKAANLSDLASLPAARAALAIEQCFGIAVGDEITAISTGTSKITFRIPFDCHLNSVRGSLGTVGTTLTTVDVNRNGTSLLTAKLTIDANEKSSSTAAAPVTYVNQDLIADDEITIDIDTAGAGGKGLKVYLNVRGI